MSIPLKLAINFFAGFIIIFLFIGTGFSGSILFGTAVIVISASIGYFLSRIPSENNNIIIWSYDFAYILSPSLFILSSSNNDPKSTLEMRLIWFGLLLIIYLACIFGDIQAKNNQEHEANAPNK